MSYEPTPAYRPLVPGNESGIRMVYIAGPMTGRALFNFPEFDRAASMLRELGLTVFNPAEHDRANGVNEKDHPTGDASTLKIPLRVLAAADLGWICAHADALYLLAGWENSRGATVEKLTADWLGLPCFGFVGGGDGPAPAVEALPPEPPKFPKVPGARKGAPVVRGLLDYFPRACWAVADLSRIGNDQHNPGEPMHWAREKSADHADCMVRHLMERGSVDTDGVRHSTKSAWRALANLEIELESCYETGQSTTGLTGNPQ